METTQADENGIEKDFIFTFAGGLLSSHIPDRRVRHYRERKIASRHRSLQLRRFDRQWYVLDGLL
jgi:hypothetical protein